MSFRKIDDFLNIYIISDLHLSYTLNRSIQNRGFINPIEHTRFIRDNINKICKSHSDVLIINGDFSSKITTLFSLFWLAKKPAIQPAGPPPIIAIFCFDII